MKLSTTILINKDFNKTALMIIIQQIMVAIATYLLGSLASGYSEKGLQSAQLILLMLCLLLSGSLMQYFINQYTTKTLFSVLKSYLQKYFSANYNHPCHFRSNEEKSQRHDTLTKEGQDTIHSAIYFYTDVLATGLNIILNTISVILITDLGLGIAIFISATIGLLLIHLGDNKISTSSEKEMLEKNNLNNTINQSWDNIIIGNKLFFNLWNKKFENNFLNAQNAAVKSTNIRQFYVSFAAFATTLLVVAYVLIKVWLNKTNHTFVIALLVMLPRSLQIVIHLQVIQSYFADWKALKEKLLLTEKSFADFSMINIEKYVNFDLIKAFYKDKIIDLKTLINIKNSNSIKLGRYTIRGENGSGKSTILTIIKNKYTEDSLYIPAKHNLEIGQPSINLSSGELVMSTILLLNNCEEKLILLDEWDANLSIENRLKFSTLLDELSKIKIIIEVCHNEYK